ncbi:MAG: hypothetical protein RBS29_00980 [Bacteroidales bacterium]|jgi:hypothetical protein|nr:hypothetical protein [Bacteroidales bacterium]
MKKRFIIPFLLPLLIFCIHVTKAQISVQSPNGWTPTQLINNVLVLPPHISGVYITNGTFNNLATALQTAPAPKLEDSRTDPIILIFQYRVAL